MFFITFLHVYFSYQLLICEIDIIIVPCEDMDIPSLVNVVNTTKLLTINHTIFPGIKDGITNTWKEKITITIKVKTVVL